MNCFNKTIVLTSLLLSTLLFACGGEDGLDSRLTVTNSSSFTIDELYFSPASSSDWGQDLLGVDLLLPGEEFVIDGIECDDYDVMLIDEDGDDCVLSSVDLCLNDAQWVITDVELAVCAAF